MKLFDKVKNLFTEEVEEEKPIRKEVRHVEIPTPRREEFKREVVEEKEEEKPVEKEKFVFFDDKDFEDLEKNEIKKEEPVIIKKEEKLPYNGNRPVILPVEEKKVFTPSPIISPVYGVLDKNYKKDDITSRNNPKIKRTFSSSKELTVDDIRDRAFATLEDDLKSDLLENDYVIQKEVVEDDLDLFGDINSNDNLDDKGFDIKTKEEKDDDLILTRRSKNLLFDEIDLDDDTEYLSKKLAEQKRKLDEINDIINEEETLNQSEKPKLTLDDVLAKVEKKRNFIEEKEELEEIDIPSKKETKKIKEIIEDIEDLEEDIEDLEEDIEDLRNDKKKVEISEIEDDYEDEIDDEELEDNYEDEIDDEELEDNYEDEIDDEKLEDNYEDELDEEELEDDYEEEIAEAIEAIDENQDNYEDELEDISDIEDSEVTEKSTIEQAFTEAFEDIDAAIEGSKETEEVKEIKKRPKKKDLTESELFNLIDTMYEKRDDE
ncbi:MAG: hypothetical protein PHN42_04865 [Bacilli bacterium]|nr:hypothetical protein [Bacilli bacterium]